LADGGTAVTPAGGLRERCPFYGQALQAQTTTLTTECGE